MLLLSHTKFAEACLRFWTANPTATTNLVDILNYYCMLCLQLICNLAINILLIVKAINSLAKGAITTSSSVWGDDDKHSKSCYIEISSGQKFGQLSEKTSLLGGSNASSLHSYQTNAADHLNGKESAKSAASLQRARLLAIGILLVGSCSIALYLLTIETRMHSGFALDLVGHEVWSNYPLMQSEQNASLSNAKLSNILILQTGNTECLDSDSCINLLRTMQATEMQNRNTEIPYNFLIGSDGQTYEVRGWNYDNGFEYIPRQTSLAIGFIGNYTLKSPSVSQLRSASSLINETKKKQKLTDSYVIYGVRNLTISHIEGDALFRRLSLWPQFETLLKIL